MRFGPMVFSELLRCARGIEIAQANEFHAMNFIVPSKNLFEREFGFAVGADGTRLRGFIDGHPIRWTKNRARRGEDDSPDVRRDHRIEQIQSIANVIPKVFRWILHRFTNQGVGGEMHHRVRASTGNGSLDLLAIGKFAFNKMRSGINSSSMAFTQVVENGNFMPLIQ